MSPKIITPEYHGYDFYGVSTWKIDCGIAKFMGNIADNLTPQNYPNDVASKVSIAPIHKGRDKVYGGLAVPEWVINQKDPGSYIHVGRLMAEHIAQRATLGFPQVVLLQHEFGLESNWLNYSQDYFHLATALRNRAEELKVKDEDLLILSYFHTVWEKIEAEYEKQERIGLKKLSEVSDGCIVMIPQAIDILREFYEGISNAYHIDHGVRELGIGKYDREEIKKEIGLEDSILLLTMGYQGPDKGLEQALDAYSRLVTKSFTKNAREKVVYLIVGDCHEEFIDSEAYQKSLRDFIQSKGLIWGNSHYDLYGKLVIRESNNPNVINKGPKSCDVVFVRERVPEEKYKRYLAASNIVVLAHQKEGQTSSGTVTDAVGAGRVIITTSFEHPLYLLGSRHKTRKQILTELTEKGYYGIDDPYAPGVMANIRQDYTEIMAGLMHRLISDKELRIAKDQIASELAAKMYWRWVVGDIIKLVHHLRRQKVTQRGRGPRIPLKAGSPYADLENLLKKNNN